MFNQNSTTFGISGRVATYSTVPLDGYSGTRGAVGGCPNGVANLWNCSKENYFGEETGFCYCSMQGYITNGGIEVGKSNSISTPEGFSGEAGYSAGDIKTNAHNWGNSETYAAKTSGGRGGQVKLFGKYFCEAGYGGKTAKNENEDGGGATGYGGCGGGGGYGLHNGGKGADGYARLSWNKVYKQGSEDEYEYTNGGSGGGGSAGNVFRYSIRVQAGDVLKYKIGKGGTGGGWTTVEKTIDGVTKNVLEQVQPTKGGMTELTTANNEVLRAGGGLGGAFPLLNAITIDVNTSRYYNKENITYGLGGAAPNLCEFINSSRETESFIDKEKLCSRKAGEDGSATGGGKGADAGFGAGTGGAAGATGGKVAANGSPAVGFGAGGGGAGLADLGTVNATDAVTNPTVGGNGGDGKIIFRWK